MFCKSDAKQSGINYNKQNQHQFLHRIASIQTFNDLQYLVVWDRKIT